MMTNPARRGKLINAYYFGLSFPVCAFTGSTMGATAGGALMGGAGRLGFIFSLSGFYGRS
jgi:hypothetical protein